MVDYDEVLSLLQASPAERQSTDRFSSCFIPKRSIETRYPGLKQFWGG